MLMPDIDVNVVVIQTVSNWPALSVMPANRVRKIAAIAMNAAAPSVLTLEPTGITKQTTLESRPRMFFVTRYVTGNVAALKGNSLLVLHFNNFDFTFDS